MQPTRRPPHGGIPVGGKMGFDQRCWTRLTRCTDYRHDEKCLSFYDGSGTWQFACIYSILPVFFGYCTWYSRLEGLSYLPQVPLDPDMRAQPVGFSWTPVAMSPRAPVTWFDMIGKEWCVQVVWWVQFDHKDWSGMVRLLTSNCRSFE